MNSFFYSIFGLFTLFVTICNIYLAPVQYIKPYLSVSNLLVQIASLSELWTPASTKTGINPAINFPEASQNTRPVYNQVNCDIYG